MPQPLHPARPCRPRPPPAVLLQRSFPVSPLDRPSVSPHLGPSTGGVSPTRGPPSRLVPRTAGNSPVRPARLPARMCCRLHQLIQSARDPWLCSRVLPRECGSRVLTPMEGWRVAGVVAVRERVTRASGSWSHGARARRNTERMKRDGAKTNRFFLIITQRWQLV
jgi:hypothetical protein